MAFNETHRKTLTNFADIYRLAYLSSFVDEAEAIDAALAEIDRLTTIQSNLNEQLVKCANQVANLKAEIRKKDMVGKRMSE